MLMLIAIGSLTTGCETTTTTPETEDNADTAITETYTISGTYTESTGEGIMYKDILSFSIDQSTAPTELQNITSVTFSNQEEAKTLFELTDEEVFTTEDANSQGCKIEGTATIEVSDFEPAMPDSDDHNDVKLEKVISKEPYTKTCE